MDKRLVIYEHRVYEEEIDTWCHRFESVYMRGSEIRILSDITDFLKEDNEDISKEYYILVSVTRIPIMEL